MDQAPKNKMAVVPRKKELAPVDGAIMDSNQGTARAELLISQAIAKKVPVETMERLLAMRKDLKNEWSKEQFDLAMSDFQSECPIIKKTKGVKTKSGQEAYRYAPIDEIVRQVKTLLSKHGFSFVTKMQLMDTGVMAVVIVKHKDGHAEESSMHVPLGNKTDIMSQSQVVAAAQTFAKRYAFCNAFGILTGDDDDETVMAKADKVQANKSNFQKAINIITKSKDIDGLIEMDNKIDRSDKYTDDEKKQIHSSINLRVNELSV